MVEVVAGRRYAVVHKSGDRDEGVAVAQKNGRFGVAGWHVNRDGHVPCSDGRWVETIEVRPEPSDESLDTRDAAAFERMVPYSAGWLQLRQVRALERAAEALECIAGVILEAFDPDGLEAAEPDADTADETGVAQ